MNRVALHPGESPRIGGTRAGSASRRRVWRLVFVWLLLLALPVQGFADAWLQAQGRAHTHESDALGDHDHEPLAGTHADEAPAHHATVEHHPHPADDASVVIAYGDEQQHEDAAAQDGGAVSGHAALARAPWVIPPALAGPAPAGQDHRFSSRTPARLDRPPIADAG